MGLAAAPLPPVHLRADQRRYHSLVGIISFTAARVTGALTLSVPDESLPLLRPASMPAAANADCLRELTNQLMGRIKNRLMNYQVTLQLGIPSTMNGEALERQRRRSPSEVAYQFRTLRGEVIVTLESTLNGANLVYSSALERLTEGELILL